MTRVLNERDEKRSAASARRKARPLQRGDSVFINRELSKEETSEYRLWREDLDNVITRWTELIEEGYRVNTKYDDYSSSCAAFIIPGDGMDNDGYILTGRGGNAYRAVSEALFKHAVIFEGVWSDIDFRPQGPDDPDF